MPLPGSILNSPQPMMHTSEFRFKWTHDSAAHNLAVLRCSYSLDLGAAMVAQPFSAMTPASEFRPAAVLAPLLPAHPLWPRFQERILEGGLGPLQEISDADCLNDVRDNLARGNHKSARGRETKLIAMLKGEVEKHLSIKKDKPLKSSGSLMTSHSTPAGYLDEA